MSAITADQLQGIQDLTEYELGFIDSTLYRMGVVRRQPTVEEFALALSVLEDFVGHHRSQLYDGFDNQPEPSSHSLAQ